MKKSIGLWQFIGFLSTSLLGTILHFLYDWLNQSAWIAPFSSVNESTWEHMKLLFWSMLIYSIIQGIIFKERKDFWCVKLRGMLLGLALIPVIFYTYNGVIGKSPDWLNISIFFISATIAYVYEARLFKSEKLSYCSQGVSIAILCIIALLFIIFTFRTPTLNIFKDPLTSTYGI